MKWLKASDYFNIISKFIILTFLEWCLCDSYIMGFLFLILNAALSYLCLYFMNNKYIKSMKRKAKEDAYIDKQKDIYLKQDDL